MIFAGDLQSEKAINVLIAHQRFEAGCLCNDPSFKVGDSHAAHVLAELAKALNTEDSEVQVTMEWGYRYRRSSTYRWTNIIPLTREQAVAAATDLMAYHGQQDAEVLRRPVLTGEWKAQDLQKLVAMERASNEVINPED